MAGPHDHFIRHPEGSKFFSVCGYCGERSDRGLVEAEVDDWEYKHERKIPTGSGRGTARLATSVKYYREKADDTRFTQRQRGLWQQLADEAERHLRDKAEQIPGQMDLFD